MNLINSNLYKEIQRFLLEKRTLKYVSVERRTLDSRFNANLKPEWRCLLGGPAINHREYWQRLLQNADETNVGSDYNEKRLNVLEANSNNENYEEQIGMPATANVVEADSGRQEIEVVTGNGCYLRPKKRKRLIVGDVDVVFEQDQNHFEANRGCNNHEAHQIEGSSLKDVLGWVFLITNFILELPSAVFGQLSSKYHPHYTFTVMLISFIALMGCIGELICKGKKERVGWEWRDKVPWLYCPRTDKPFGTLWETIGFACAFFQFILTAINYSFISRHIDGPIKTSALPIIFAFGLLSSKYLEKRNKKRGNPMAQYGGSTCDLDQIILEG